MADKFGRHKSTRWVRASVPTYGDEWDDDYDYDYGSSHESENERAQHKQVVSEGVGTSSYNGTKGNEGIESNSETQKNPNLVLSIDRLRNRTVDSDSSSEDDLPEIVDESSLLDQNQENGGGEEERDDEGFNFSPAQQQVPGSSNESVTNTDTDRPIQQTIKYNDVLINTDLIPPTPTFNSTHINISPDTPQSERSFLSDTDSIQKEPENINVVEPNTFNLEAEFDESKIRNQMSVPNPQGDCIEKEINSEVPHEDIINTPAPLVLSIDRKDFNNDESSDDDDDDDDDDEDDWGYNSQHSSNDEEMEKNNESSKEGDSSSKYEKLEYTSPDSSLGAQKSRNQIKIDALDSLINDLQNATLGHDVAYDHGDDNGNDNAYNDKYFNKDNNKSGYRSDEYNEVVTKTDLLPKIETLHDISLPNFENDSFSHYEEYDKTLDLNKILSNSELESSQSRPILPLSIAEEKKGHENFINELSGHKRSIRKPPPSGREQLVSMDYSNIADAVSGYMNEQQNIGTKELEDISDISDNSDNLETESIDDETLSTPELQPITSSGSLSTGKLSIDTNNATSQPIDNIVNSDFNGKDNISRRTSTISTSTFNMGNWKPNTSNYRDQFIDDNDNESQVNFNPYTSEVNNNYNKFTKLRTVSGSSDAYLNSSSVSVPETIDAALPSIIEDPDDDNNATINDSNTIHTIKSNYTTDSVLKDHSYIRPLFKEEKLTPLGSKDSLSKKDEGQKYSSLLAPQDKTKEKEPQENQRTPSDTSISGANNVDAKRLMSTSTTSSSATTLDQSVKKVFTPQVYPLYSWKNIMATSQPIDRICLLKDALAKESAYDTGLQNWLHETLKSSESASNIHIGEIASQAYQNATHNDIRRHSSIRSKVSIVKDKVETSGLQASSLGKRFLSRGKKFMKSAGGGD